MSSRTAVLAAACCLAGSACATGFSAGVSPEEVPALEEVVAIDSTDAEAWTRLGVAYGLDDRPADARAALERAVTLPDPPTAAWAHLGRWREETGDVEGAVVAYRRYLELGGRAEDDVRARLAVVERELVQQRARVALAMEDALNDVPPDPATVGVFPLAVEGPEQYAPLGVGLAELLTTDLSMTDRLQVVERAQLDALVDEMELALAGFTDPASAARAGRLLRAGRLVQGRLAITEESGVAQVDALVVDAADSTATGQAGEGGPLETLMDMEVRLVLEIYRQLGIELTPSERARLEDRPTTNLQAFLSYSEGLQLMDAGEWAAAAARFEAAVQMDPGFEAAGEQARRATGAARSTTQSVSRATTPEVAAVAGVEAQSGGGTALDQLVNTTVPAGVGATTTGGENTTTPATDAVTVENTETTAGTGVGKTIVVPIVLTRPRPSLRPGGGGGR